MVFSTDRSTGSWRRKDTPPKTIIRKLREAEVLQGQGQTIAQVLKQLGVTEQTFYRWRKEYGGMRVDQANRLPGPGRAGNFRAFEKVQS